MNCRHCKQPLNHVFLDLGYAPPSNAYLTNIETPETYFPLKLFVCDNCWLVQTRDYARADELFNNQYAYFSSTSRFWTEHAKKYFSMIVQKLKLGPDSFVLEIGSNDGYLLKNFLSAGIPCLGIEPTESTAAAARNLGIPVQADFFGLSVGQQFAGKGNRCDLIIGNNVFAHVPDINDFAHGLKAALKPGGTITLEFPHLMNLIEHTQFDTVYHEHFSYLSVYTARRIFENAGLRIWDVEELPTHGGSVRIYGCHADDLRKDADTVAAMIEKERSKGMREIGGYQHFQTRVDAIKDNLIMFLIEQKRAGRHVAGYGAAAKGNTLLNYTGVKPDLLQYVCDAAPSKQGKYMPGSHIPILPPRALRERHPDILLILPWNIADEVVHQHGYIREWGGKFGLVGSSIRLLT